MGAVNHIEYCLQMMKKQGVELDTPSINAIIRGYGQRGDIGKMLEWFQRIEVLTALLRCHRPLMK